MWLTAAILLMIATISLITTFCYYRIYHKRRNRRRNSLAKNVNWSTFFAISSLLNHGLNFFQLKKLSEILIIQCSNDLTGYRIPHPSSRLLSVRFLTTIWCMMSMVLINYYSSSLTSYLAVTTFTPIVNSLEELAAKENLKLTIEVNSLLANQILVSSIF